MNTVYIFFGIAGKKQSFESDALSKFQAELSSRKRNHSHNEIQQGNKVSIL